ncbi:MAG TPA: hypothetical protein VFR30_01670, partial [Lysobacter sp.]|nr:hypothetical protein [Lysobacter sp.]
MGSRTASSTRKAPRAGPVSVDLVVVSLHNQKVQVLMESAAASRRRGLILPWGTPARGEALDAAAARIAKNTLGFVPGWIEQAGAFSDGTGHPGNAVVSVCYVAVVPWESSDVSQTWVDAHPAPVMPDRQRRMLGAAISALRHRLEHAPIAFSMLSREFTLSELQQAYETMLARRLHKASFRRA